MKEQSILSLTLVTDWWTSLCVHARNEAKTYWPGFVKLTAGGLSHSEMLNRVKTHDTTFDVPPVSALHNFVVASARSASREIRRRLRKKISEPTGVKHKKPRRGFLSENVIAANSEQSRRSL